MSEEFSEEETVELKPKRESESSRLRVWGNSIPGKRKQCEKAPRKERCWPFEDL